MRERKNGDDNLGKGETKAAGEAEMPAEPLPVFSPARRPRQSVGEARYQQMLALKEAGLSTGSIAKRLGVEQRTIQCWQAGERNGIVL